MITPELQLARLRIVEELAGIGSWSWNPRSNAVTWSQNLRKLLGFDDYSPASFDVFMSMVDESQREESLRISSEAVTQNKPYSNDFKMTTLDGRTMRVHAKGSPVDVNGEAFYVGVVVDVTDAYEVQNKLNKTIDIMHGVISMTEEVARATKARTARDLE